MTIQEMIAYLETYRQSHNITYTGELNEADLAVLVEDPARIKDYKYIKFIY